LESKFTSGIGRRTTPPRACGKRASGRDFVGKLRLAAASRAATRLLAWRRCFGDERCAPSDDAERNSRMTRSAWLDHVAIADANVREIRADLGAAGAARGAGNAAARSGG
jgi:hypothetical protein